MSRRNDLRVPKYAFIKFACDGKTLQAKTMDLESDGIMAVNSEVLARWENELLKATILGLSDDPTILIEKEREYMRSIKQRPSQKGKKPTIRQTATLKNRTKAPKRKETLDIVFIPSKIRKPKTSRDSSVPVAAFSFERMTSEQTEKIKKLTTDRLSTPVPSSLPTLTAHTPPSTSSCTDSPHSSVVVPSSPSDSLVAALLDPSFIPYFPDLDPPSPSHDILPNSVFPIHLPSTELPTILNMDTQEITPENSRLSSGTPTRAEDLTNIVGKLDDVLNYMRRLEAKVDALVPRDPSPPVRVSIATQTDVVYPESSPVSDQTPTIYDVSLSVDQTESPITPLPSPIIPHLPPYTDSRIWQIRPSDLDGEQVTPELLTKAIVELPINHTATDDMNISETEMIAILSKSHSSANLAKNLMFRGFKLQELYGRNANGRNYGGPKKAALNKIKVQKIVDIVGLHYKEDNVEKKTITALNSGLRYLWNVRFKHTWLQLNTIPNTSDIHW